MQINANNSSLTLTTPRTPYSGSQQKQTRAHNSYTQNASSATIIDAEYVEISSPAKQAFIRERQTLDSSVLPDSNDKSFSAEEAKEQKALSAKFQVARPDTPPPGSYVNIFA